MKNTALAATLIWFLAAPLIASGQAPTPVKPVAPAAASPRPAAAGAQAGQTEEKGPARAPQGRAESGRARVPRVGDQRADHQVRGEIPLSTGIDTAPVRTTAGRLRDRIALVTGAGSVGPGWGNGRAIAFRFAQEGAKVWAVNRNLDHLEETLARVRAIGGTIEAYCCDVTDGDAVAAMVRACRDAWGRLDILVNNVGGPQPGGPVEMTEEVLTAQVDQNLKSVYLCCKHALPLMEAQGAGTIVNIASTSALRWTGSAQVAYAATKAGVMQLTRVVAAQYAAQGDSREYRGARPAAYADGRGAACRAARRRRRRCAVATAAGAHSAGLHGRRSRYRERRIVSRIGRGALHHRRRDRRRRRHDDTLRLTRCGARTSRARR